MAWTSYLPGGDSPPNAPVQKRAAEGSLRCDAPGYSGRAPTRSRHPQTTDGSRIHQSEPHVHAQLFIFFFVAARRGMGRRQPPRLRSRAFIWKSSIRDEAACFVNALHCSVAAKSPTLYVPTNIPELKVPRYVLSSRAEHRSSSAPRPADLPSWSDESSQGESRGRSVGRSANLRRPANRSSPTGQRPSPSNLEAGRWHAPIPSPAIPRFPVPPPTHLFFFFFFSSFFILSILQIFAASVLASKRPDPRPFAFPDRPPVACLRDDDIHQLLPPGSNPPRPAQIQSIDYMAI